MSAYPPDFLDWSEAKRNAFFKAEADTFERQEKAKANGQPKTHPNGRDARRKPKFQLTPFNDIKFEKPMNGSSKNYYLAKGSRRSMAPPARSKHSSFLISCSTSRSDGLGLGAVWLRHQPSISRPKARLACTSARSAGNWHMTACLTMCRFT